MNLRHVKLISLLILFSSIRLISFEPAKNLKFFKEITDPTPGANADIFRILLDSDVYDVADDSFNNIRLLNAKGSEVPFSIDLLRKTENAITTECVTAKIAKVNKTENVLELIITMPESTKDRKEISGVKIETPSKNFEKEVSIEFSDDCENWSPLAQKESIFDYSEFIPVSKKTLSFPKQKAKNYYRLRIANFAEDKKSPRIELINEKRTGLDFSSIEKIVINKEFLKIDSISFFVETEEKTFTTEEKIQYKALDFKTQENNNNTEILFSTRREPLQELILKTNSANFARTCSIFGSNDGKNWEPLSSGEKIYSIETSSYKDSKLKLNLRGRYRYYKILISNHNSPPIQVSGVELYGYVHTLNIISSEFETGKQAFLYYGGNNVPAPSYDTREIIEQMKNPSYKILTLSEEKTNTLFSGKTSIFENKVFFYTAVIFMIICLSAVIYKSLKKVDTIQGQE